MQNVISSISTACIAEVLGATQFVAPNGLTVGSESVGDQHVRYVDARSAVDFMVDAKRTRLEGLDVGIVVEQDEEIPLTNSLEEV